MAAFLELIRRNIELGETFPFPELDRGEYLKMEKVDKLYLSYFTSIDEIMDRCKIQGIKIVAGEHLMSGNPFGFASR